MPASPIVPRPPPASPATSVNIRGGKGAPHRARRHLRAQLHADVPRARASDAALIVSELVTNSVLHAQVSVHETLVLEVTPVGDLLRIAVTDHGSQLEPQIRRASEALSGGFGLQLVDRICSAWGVVREASGATRVWCEVPLGRAAAG